MLRAMINAINRTALIADGIENLLNNPFDLWNTVSSSLITFSAISTVEE